jgi:lipooligosaccharide transport system ATP-binding protein
MATRSDGAIIVSNVTKTYGSLAAVKGLSFSVGISACVGLLGPNGAGKTTMMKMIYGKCLRDPAPRSSISVFGYDPGSHELEIKFLSGVVPQENNLDEELNVWQNLHVYSKLYGMSNKRAAARIGELLDFMELGDKRAVKIKELSGGMKRRLIIARALLNSPHLLILDEPTTGLDPQVRHLIWEKLRQLKKDGLSVLLTTHYMEEAFQLCDSILIMHRGEKMMEGAPRSLLESRLERYVLEISGSDAFTRTRALAGPSIRSEDGSGAGRLYSNDSALLKTLAAPLSPGEYNIRETNLEDLFLQTTGSTLDENQ